MTLIDFRVPQESNEHKLVTGRHIVCWGSSGSGKTSLATNLAFEFAMQDRRVFLVDADNYHPSIAALLGLIDSGSGISACLRLCRQGRITADDLFRLAQKIEFEDKSVHVITGMPALSRWNEMNAAALADFAKVLEENADYVIWDVASYLELSLYGSDSATGRNEATCSLLEISDLTLGVFLADPVGVNRFLFDCQLAGDDFWPIANRVRSSVLGRRPESEVAKVIQDVAGISLVESIREDSGFDTMLATAKPLRFQGKNSKAMEAIGRLAKKAAEYLEE
jgi:MinD-like ATPase involved in chromosome partitioning or flagellar assembly